MEAEREQGQRGGGKGKPKEVLLQVPLFVRGGGETDVRERVKSDEGW